jgi:hypothetical protein
MTLKQRFLDAVTKGELGSIEDRGVIVTLAEFKHYFKDIHTRYITSFLPAAVIEPGQHSVSHTKYLFRIRKGVYLVHSDAIEKYRDPQLVDENIINESGFAYMVDFIKGDFSKERFIT